MEITEEPDRERWLEACSELSDASLAPWVLLSAGVSFEDFVHQTEIACQAGAWVCWRVGQSGKMRWACQEMRVQPSCAQLHTERLAQLRGQIVSMPGQALDRFPSQT